jgi:pimeloyl-ACP methyl ester carboxylesterase
MRPEPFTLHIEQSKLEDLRERLSRTRWPDMPTDIGWSYGTDSTFMKRLVSYWSTKFNWRTQEDKLNQFPQFTVKIGDIDLHYLHVPAKTGDGRPLLLSHGWPGSVFEFIDLIPRLTDPERFGGRSDDAFTVVAPCLPGYGLSFKPGQRLVPIRDIADCFVTLMTDVLGYDRFCAQGGDIGSWVTSRLGAIYPEKLIGIHLNMLVYRKDQDTNPPPPANSAEEKFTLELMRWRQEEGGYIHIQGTRPQTLAYGLSDSPAGLAAWIIEKFRTWSDCNGDLESVFTLDQLLADISLYWLTGTIGSSFGPYHDRMYDPATIDRLVTAPMGYCEFPSEIVRPPRSFAERTYSNIKHWTVMERGGHFAAMEQPAALAADIRRFYRELDTPISGSGRH